MSDESQRPTVLVSPSETDEPETDFGQCLGCNETDTLDSFGYCAVCSTDMPDAMAVDRQFSATSEDEREEIKTHYGIETARKRLSA